MKFLSLIGPSHQSIQQSITRIITTETLHGSRNQSAETLRTIHDTASKGDVATEGI